MLGVGADGWHVNSVASQERVLGEGKYLSKIGSTVENAVRLVAAKVFALYIIQAQD